jgi:hypothetical protein
MFLLFDMTGINESKLISNPINQEFDEFVINIPSSMAVKKASLWILSA